MGARQPEPVARWAAGEGYQARLAMPQAVLGVQCTTEVVTGLVFLAPDTPLLAPQNALAAEVARQLAAYLADPRHVFDLPLHYAATPHQAKVWQALQAIPCGQVRTYGDLARELHSAAQAVGQACGANPLPLVIPCHRVVSRSGLGGFMQQRSAPTLDIKRWLLAHEQR